MNGCTACQGLLLDHLYGLLDADEEQGLRSHLASCPECQGEMERARAQQRLLAAAALQAFPEVAFTPPAAEPVLLPIRPRLPKKPRRWAAWASAACVLLALSPLAVPAYRAAAAHAEARRTADERDAGVASARTDLSATESLIALASTKRDKAVGDVRREVMARALRLVVSGPNTIQAGAAAEFQVRALDLEGKPAEADLTVRIDTAKLKDGKPAEGGKGAADDKGPLDPSPRVERVEKGLYRVHLPPTLPVEAGHTLAMAFTARRSGNGPGDGRKPLSLVGAVRLTQPVFLTHLTTDRPMYQPGDTVHFRSLTLDRATLTPPVAPLQLRYSLTPPAGPARPIAAGLSSLRRLDTLSEKLDDVAGPDGKPLAGLGAGEVLLGANAGGGEYTLAVSEETGRFLPVTRKFLVNEYKKPRLDRKLELNRPSYGPGDEVQVLAKARRLDGGPLGECPVAGSVVIDGRTAGTASGKLNEAGEAVLSFQLPRGMQRGVGSVSVQFKDSGTPETSSRPLPIVLDRLDVEFFPEGGDLVAGLPGRVYFSARTPAGKPAQVAGTLLEDGKPLDVKAETMSDDKEPGVNQGLGSFRFTPKAGKAYSLRVDSPRGVTKVPALPQVKADGIALTVNKGVFQADESIEVRVASLKPRHLLVGAYCRDTLLDSAQLDAGQAKVDLASASPVGGVCRITVFEVVPTGAEQRALRPVAERLVYRHPGKRVDVSILPGSKQHAPGERASLKIHATDEQERRVAVIAQVAVVDWATLGLADERTARTMPTHFLLTTEVRRAEDLEQADFLIGQHPKAPAVLDHLLGTQGWRRFAEQDAGRFRGRTREESESLPESERQLRESDGERLLVMMGQSTPRRTDFDQERIDKAQADYEETADELQRRHDAASDGIARAAADPAYLAAVATLSNNGRYLRQGRLLALPLLAALALFAAWHVLSRLAKDEAAWMSSAFGTACAGVLVWLAGTPAGVNVPTPPAGDELARLMIIPPDDAAAWPAAPEAAVPTRGSGIEGGAGGPVPPPTYLPTGDGKGEGKTTASMSGGGRGGFKGKGDMARADKAAEDRFERALAFRRPLPQAERIRLLADSADGKAGGMAPAPPGLMGRPGGFGFGGGKRSRLEEGKAKEKKDIAYYFAPLVYREYAHVRPEGLSPSVRSDFAETVYWHPVLVLPDGSGEVAFQLPDSVTRYQAAVFAHTLDGRLGAATRMIDSRLPVNIAPRLPTEVTATDRILLPVGVSSTVDKPLDGKVTVAARDGLDVEGDGQAFALPANGSRRVLFSVKPSVREGAASLTLEARGAGFAGDAVRDTVRVVPDGFPVEGSSSDLLEKSATHKVSLPADMVPGSLRMRVDVYPSPLADLTKGLEGLLREPYGCFEQTSTTNYPNVLVLDYLKAAGAAKPDVEQKARTLLAKGYAKLTGYECLDMATSQRRGYEWFGGTAPPHDALTAYGLLQFNDMARLHPVDSAMLVRTRDYLLSLRDGKGGFTRSTKKMGAFGYAPDDVSAAYLVWALSETGSDGLAVEQAALLAKASKTEDGYFNSLVALGLVNAGKAKEAKDLLTCVARAQKADGSLDAETSITRSGGADLKIEATALAVMAWLKSDRIAFGKNVHLAVKWLGTQRQGSGSFGSTQSTILALKALLAHSANDSRDKKDAELVLFHGERELARVKVTANAAGAVSLEVPAPETLFKAGVAGKLRAEITSGAAYPHTLSWACRAVKPANEPTQLVKLTASLSAKAMTEGETARVTVRVQNLTGQPQGMATAVIGLPAGLSLPENLEQLRAHCKLPADGKAPLLSAFEVNGREVVLYWRGLDRGQSVEVPFDVVAKVPGTYRGPASRAYLYYNARNKHWVDPLAVEIKPAG